MDDVLISFGGGIEAKSVGEGLTELRGPSVIFDPHDGTGTDLAGEYFAADTYFGPGVSPGKTAEFEATFNHGIPTQEGLKALADYEFKNPVKTEVTEAGVIASLLLDEREEYEKMLAEFARKNPGKLGWSTATAAHRAKREKKSDGRAWIKRWPIVEIAVTHKPCEPRTSAAIPLKSYAASEAKAVDGERLFNESLRQTEQQTWELWSAVQTGARKIAEASVSSDVTGVEVDVRAAVTSLVGAYSPRLIEAIVSQINEWKDAETRDEHFYLKSGFEEFNEGGLPAGLPFAERLEMVRAAVERVATDAKEIQAMRARATKAGRVISAANRTRIQAVIDAMNPLLADLLKLVEESEPKQPEAKSVPFAALRMQTLRLQSRVAGVPLSRG